MLWVRFSWYKDVTVILWITLLLLLNSKGVVNPNRQKTGFRRGTVPAKAEVNDTLQSFVVLIKWALRYRQLSLSFIKRKKNPLLNRDVSNFSIAGCTSVVANNPSVPYRITQKYRCNLHQEEAKLFRSLLFKLINPCDREFLLHLSIHHTTSEQYSQHVEAKRNTQKCKQKVKHTSLRQF